MVLLQPWLQKGHAIRNMPIVKAISVAFTCNRATGCNGSGRDCDDDDSDDEQGDDG